MSTEFAILEILEANPRWMYGLDIVKASDGRVKRGTVYVHLQRLEDAGFVASKQEDETPVYIGIPRRLYRLTGKRYVPSLMVPA